MRIWQEDSLHRLDVLPDVEPLPDPIQEPLPLPVVPDWSEQLAKAQRMAGLIDRHLDYEERGRRMLTGERLSPIGLCPEQRVQMMTDARATAHP